MKKVRTFPVFCVLSHVLIAVCSAKRGFVFTSPKVLDAGSTEYFTLALFDVPSRGSINLSLTKHSSNDVIAETNVFAHNNYNTWIQMDIPDFEHDVATLHLRGVFIDGYKIIDQREVRIRRHSVVTFIQTDKPIYKPGQTVRFRVLPMDSQLIPLSGEIFGDAWVEDPSTIRIAQWKDVNLSEGIAQFELPLSEEPVYGKWTIHTKVKNVTQTQTFNVEEYVLPKFDVTIVPPSYVMVTDKKISVKICAKYTYGKSVDGLLRAKMTQKKRSYEVHSLPSVEYEGKMSGCTDFVVDSDELHKENGELDVRTIMIFAEVTENGTGIVQNGSATLTVAHLPLQLKFLGDEKSSRYFKPGLSYHGKVKVTKPDGTPSGSESVNICVTVKYVTNAPDLQSCSAFISDKEGLIDFIIPAQNADVYQITLDARTSYKEREFRSSERRRYMRTNSPHSRVFLEAWHSPSQSYLQIEPVSNDVQCDRLEKVRIRYTTNKWSTIKFYHEVFSRGRIVQLGSHSRSFYADEGNKEQKEDAKLKSHNANAQFTNLEKFNGTNGPHVGEFIFTFDARSTMSPVARLLVFYVREDGEVVADSRSFRITHCLRNQVKFLFRHSQQYPGTETAMLLSGNPSSLCGINMVDKSIHIMHPEQKFNKDKVFRLMESFDVGKRTLPKRVSEKCRNRQSDDYLLRRRKRSFSPRFPIVGGSVDATAAFDEAGAIVMSDLILETLPCPPIPPPFHGNAQDLVLFDTLQFPRNRNLPLPILRQPDVEKVHKEEASPEEEKEEIRSYFPETWLWELHKIGSSGEIALKRELPHTITTWMGGAVCVHPKHGLGISDTVEIIAFQPFFASFNLPYSVVRGETVSIVVSVFNYLKECLPITISLEPTDSYTVGNDSNIHHSLCLCGERSKTTKFLITPTVLGHVNITVYVYTVKDELVCGNEIISRISARDAVTRQLLVEAEGFPKEENFNAFFCPRNENGSYAWELDLFLPNDVVTDSARAYMSVTGDLMGPALNGLEKLVCLPTGCGEQNMVLFTPNIHVLDYLISSNRITDDIKSKALDFMKRGYQKELRYRHKDGAYSAFGDFDVQGSMWLTAFVVKSFAQARRFISIDEQDLMISTRWILNRQLENGCFAPEGELLQKSLQGGLLGQGSLAPLTAYVLASLLESGFNHTEMVKSATYCLQADQNPSTYTLALFAYAAALAGNKALTEQYLQDLEERAVKQDNLMYWITGHANAISTDVETAGYAILAMLRAGGTSSVNKVLPIIRWVAKQRNSNGGFVSTQDTVVALQALSRYSSITVGEKLDIRVSVTSDHFAHKFEINETNRLLTQTIKLPVVPTVADLEGTGEGCALAQFSLRYNVENSSGSDMFDLKIKSTRQGSYGCNTPTLGVCMRYKIPYQESNMAVLEIKMISGYVADEWSLYKLREIQELGLKRHEIIENTINFYFDQITNQQNCFHFLVRSEIEVENGKEARAKLYDYYKPGIQITTSYNIPSFCSLTPLPELPPLLPMIFDEQLVDTTTIQFQEAETEIITENNVPAATTTDTTLDAEQLETTSETAQEPNTTIVNLPQDEDVLLADSPDYDVPQVQNFVSLDEDLSFPEGIEGNQPVFVEPPDDFVLSQDCPVCGAHMSDFANTFCTMAFALRISLRNPEEGTIKILHDISPHHPKPQIVKAFGILRYDPSCNCSALSQRGVVFVMGRFSSSWTVSNSTHQINLTSNVQVIAAQNGLVQPIEIKRARRKCA